MIWLVGDMGMLGKEVAIALEREGLEYIGTDTDVDFTSFDTVKEFCRIHQPEWIINCAAYTAVDRAERESEKAHILNVEGPRNMAVCAEETCSRLIHVSTDYVFGNHGLSRPLEEEDPVDPESVYGKTKWEGEEAVRKELDEHFIVRISWLYGRSGKNFVYTMLKLMGEKEKIKVVNDQWGSPTWAFDVAQLFLHLIRTDSKAYGTFHYSGEGYNTWYDFSLEIQKQALELGLLETQCSIEACDSKEFPTDAKRPSWSVFSKQKIKAKLDIHIPKWQKSLRKFLEQLKKEQ
jgi:dTDP-4-dehydrorhamnose reductase